MYRASNEVYFEEQMIKIFLSNFHHCWMSFEGMSEAYNESFRQNDCVSMIKNFLVKNQNVGNHFKRSVKGDAADSIDPMYVEEEEEENLNDMHEMHRKNLSAVVFNYWVVEELKERNLMGKFLFGPYYLDKEKKHTVTFKDSVNRRASHRNLENFTFVDENGKNQGINIRLGSCWNLFKTMTD